VADNIQSMLYVFLVFLVVERRREGECLPVYTIYLPRECTQCPEEG
jgi:hypothetical protein